MGMNFLISPLTISLSFTGNILLQRGIFNIVNKIKKGKTLGDAGDKIKKDLIPLMGAGLMFWPAISYINFSRVPLQNRAPFMSIAGVIWNIGMSSQINKKNIVE
jgi:hypothetical protein